jgi:hypothetical protein
VSAVLTTIQSSGSSAFVQTENQKIEWFTALLKEPSIQAILRSAVEAAAKDLLAKLELQFLKGETTKVFLKYFIDETIATSELHILKRLTAVESMLGLSDLENECPTLPERVERIEKEAEKKTFDITGLPEMPSTVTDIRTDFLIQHLKTNEDTPKMSSPFADMELPFCNSKEFRFFVNDVLPDKYKPRSLKNIRKLKKDIFENAVRRYKDLVSINKSFHGNKELLLVMPRQLPSPSVTG